MQKTWLFPACRAARIGRSRNRERCDDRDRGRRPFLRTTRRSNRRQEPIEARFLAVLWAEWRSWAQTTPASNDLRGGVCGIALPVASCKRPRQNSQDRSLIQPGSAFSMTSTKRRGPSTVSRRRTSSNEARLIACARTLASDRGCEPIGSHQKNFCSSSDRKSFGSRYVVDPSMVFYIASDAACGHFRHPTLA